MHACKCIHTDTQTHAPRTHTCTLTCTHTCARTRTCTHTHRGHTTAHIQLPPAHDLILGHLIQGNYALIQLNGNALHWTFSAFLPNGHDSQEEEVHGFSGTFFLSISCTQSPPGRVTVDRNIEANECGGGFSAGCCVSCKGFFCTS